MAQKTITSFFVKRPNDDDNQASATKKVKLSPTKEYDRDVADPPRLNVQVDDKSTPLTTKLDKTENLTSSTPTKALPIPANIDMKVVINKTISRGALALHENIGISWFRALQGEFNKPYFHELSKFVLAERRSKVVYPPEHLVYSWTHHHDIRATKVVILGQDPYHGPNQAHGLCFSVQKGIKPPPSLENIFKELASDIKDFVIPNHGNLTGWVSQGVLLLNACLTVNQGAANSHSGKGWEKFTDSVISWISKNVSHSVVFLLWGSPAQKKKTLISTRHKILTAVHPSPLSAYRGFFGCKHFSQTNEYLRKQALPEIDWKAL